MENNESDEKESEHQEDTWNEVPEENLPCGTLDTLLHPQDIIMEDRNIFSFAPAEGNTPLNIYFDKNAEELSFPTIFCGDTRIDDKNRDVKVSYADICKSELRNADRRVASHILNIFFKFKKLQTKHVMDKAHICIRKTKTTRNLDAGYLKCVDNLESLCRHDDGFRILKDLRGSPPYWEQAKKDIFALIRQLGIPTWFASFSAAETHWIHLLKILGQTVYNKEYTDEEI
jgi:hypothetical protein